jgi:hypothetical protein
MVYLECDQDSRECATGETKVSLAAFLFYSIQAGHVLIPNPFTRPFILQNLG